MKRTILIPFAAMMLLAGVTHGQATNDSEFLISLDGQWAGDGMVKIRTDRDPIKVTCSFNSDGGETSLSLNGKCRGLVVVNRSISADLSTDGGRYRGQYLGAGSGKADLNGRRNGNQLELTIRWAKEVNGDRKAQLKLRKVGKNGMRLTTVDVDPESGDQVVTSEINLVRQ